MPGIELQKTEQIYIVHGVQDNHRADGRNCLDYRLMEIETDVINNCNGSCLLKLGDTKLLAGVKAELSTPLASSPDRGRIEVSIDITPHAHVDFEGKGGDDFASDVSTLLTQNCNDDKSVDLKSLCVIPGQQAWVLYVDIMVLGYGGNYIDAASIAAKVALYNTKIHCVSVKCDDENEPEIEISDDPYDVFSLDVTNLPILITLYRIGGEFIVDATAEEESCCIAKLVLAVSPKEVVRMKQIGESGSIHIESVQDAIEMGQAKGTVFQKQLMEFLHSEKDLPKNKFRL
ncbi:exosome complex component RRP42 [Parasteatoda tepidariorum]|uniref:Ribosomal RNA-processing protein 42 n=1 Tax=Parasteatoda tepidariorum TaxID=114398 RepID=A0A2L2XVX0_PARTP|nr:exosome complex component RRP42 [Parasteatoda tepidariorum]